MGDVAGHAPWAEDAGSDRLIGLLSHVIPDEAGRIAAMLTDEFGPLPNVLSASRDAIMKASGCEPIAADLLVTVKAVLEHILVEPLRTSVVVHSLPALQEYLQVVLAHERVEQVRALYLNAKNHLLREEIVSRGTPEETPVFPRQLMKRALELDATGLILVHNHPSGDPEPSRADRRLTIQLARAGEVLDIRLKDHVIVARAGMFSFSQAGIL